MVIALCWFGVLSLLCSSVSALPVPAPTDTSLNLFPLAFSPLVVLLVLKLGYWKYRRNQLNRGPSEDSSDTSSSISIRIGSFTLHVRFVQTTYLVGFLGSPTWETRPPHISRGAAQVLRLRRRSTSCTPSPVLYSRIFGASSHTVQTFASPRQRQWRHNSVSRDGNGLLDIHSCASVHPSSPACATAAPLPSMPSRVHIPTRRGCSSPQLRSPSLTQVMQPILSAMVSDYTNKTDADCESHTSHPTKRTSSESGLCVDCRNNASDTRGCAISVYQGASVAVPPPVRRVVLRPRSCIVTTEQWERFLDADVSLADLPAPPVPIQDHFPKPQDHASSHVSVDALVPLTPTTRPLNGVARTRRLSPPGLMVDPLSLTEMLAGKRRTVRPRQKLRSGSPPVGPSPLRNSFMMESSGSLVAVDSRPNSSVVSVCPSWELDDLVVNGQLDVNAVSAALGLGLSMASNQAIGECASESVELNISNLISYETPEGPCTTSAGWECAYDASRTTLQTHVPGEQLFAIPEEAEDVLSVDTSMHGSAHSRSTVIRLSDIDANFLTELASLNTIMSISGGLHGTEDCRKEFLWQDERKWRDTVVDASGSIGEAY